MAEAEGYTVDCVMSRQVGQKVSSQATTHNGKNNHDQVEFSG